MTLAEVSLTLSLLRNLSSALWKEVVLDGEVSCRAGWAAAYLLPRGTVVDLFHPSSYFLVASLLLKSLCGAL